MNSKPLGLLWDIIIGFQELHWYGATKYPARCAYRSVVLWFASVKIEPSFDFLIRFHNPYSTGLRHCIDEMFYRAVQNTCNRRMYAMNMIDNIRHVGGPTHV